MPTKTKFVGFDVLKRTVSIEQVLARYGLLEQLQRRGDSLTGACPLHEGHNPTQFHVSLTKNCFICFGDCQGGGSIIDFVSRKEGVGIREAALLIQDWFGLQPIATANSPSPVTGQGEGNGPERLDDTATNPPLRFTLRHLNQAHPYLVERGLSKETLGTFGPGYCSQGSLSGWIAIPIHNEDGQLVAYAGRWPGPPPNGHPKYRLPRGFHKSLELFNLHRAKTVTTEVPLVVVEGFFGCMMVWQAGHRRVVSLMGSMLSKAQERQIVETVGPDGEVVLLFDEDESGRKGRSEAQRRLAGQMNVRVVRLAVEGMQPDQLAPEQLRSFLQPS